MYSENSKHYKKIPTQINVVFVTREKIIITRLLQKKVQMEFTFLDHIFFNLKWLDFHSVSFYDQQLKPFDTQPKNIHIIHMNNFKQGYNEYFFHSTPQRSRTIRGQKRSLWMQNRFVTDLFVCGAWYSNTLLATWHKWHALCLRPIALEYPADITVLLHITSLLIKFSNRIISRRVIDSRCLWICNNIWNI